MYVVATVNLATIKYITMKITLTYAPGFCLSISSDQQTVSKSYNKSNKFL